MADNTESIGGVSVSITGDASGLGPAFTAAQSQAQQAGTAIASSFNTAAASSNQLTSEINRLILAIQQEGAASNLAMQRNTALAGSIRQVGQAAHGSVSEIQAVGGAIRVGLGEQSIRAVERFLTMIPGLASALQVAFPVIGALALGSAIVRAAGKSDELTKALEAQAQAAKEADDAETHLIGTLDQLAVKNIGRQSGPASEAKARVEQLKMEAQDAQNVLLGLQSELKKVDINAQGGALTHPVGSLTGSFQQETAAKRQEIEEKMSKQLDIVQEKYAEAGDAALEAGKKAAEQGGALREQELKNAEGAAARFAELSKAQAEGEIEATRQRARASNDALQSQQARMVAEADAEVAKAKASQEEIQGYALATRDRQIANIKSVASAESAGKSQSEQQSIGLRAAGDIQKAKDDYAATIEKAQESTSTAVNAQAEAYVTAAREEAKAQKDFNLEMERTATLQAHWADEYKERSDKQHDEDIRRFNESQRGSLALQKSLNPQGGVTLGTQSFSIPPVLPPGKTQTDLGAAIDLKSRGGQSPEEQASELDGLKQKLQDEQQLGSSLQQQLATRQQILQVQIAQATANGQGDQTDKLAAAQNQIQQTLVQFKSLNFGDIAQSSTKAVIAGVDGISQAMARAIVAGKGFGKAMTDSLKQIGTSILASAIEVGLKRILSSLLGLIPGFQAVSGAQAGAAAQQKAIASASVLTAAGEAAAWGFESVMAALPFPINVTVAPEVATAAFAQTSSFGAFAAGTESAPGGYAMVGEKGPELMYVPKGAQITPNHALKGYASGTPGYARSSYASSANMSIGEMHFHAHGVQNPRQFAEMAVDHVPKVLKARSSAFSPYSK